MSTIPDEGLIQAYLDDELSDEDRRGLEDRFDREPRWAEAFRAASARSDELSQALALLDEPPTSDGVPAWISSLSGRRGRAVAPRNPSASIPWARAAILVLVFGGAMAAGLPGSPVREWLGRTLGIGGTEPAPVAVAPAAAEAAPAVDAGSDEVGVRVSGQAGNIRVEVATLPAGAEVRVRLIDGGAAGVFGPTGTRFRTSDGRVEVLNPDRVVRVELPRTLGEATITVGGQVYLRKLGPRVEVSGPVSDSTGTEIRFRPGPGGG